MYTVSSQLLSKSGLSVEQADALLAGHGKLNGLGAAFLQVEEQEGVNALWGMAQAIQETGWGVSAIAEDKNNLFGINAVDSNPYGEASVYNSAADCVLYWGSFISKDYLTPGGAFYVSPTPAGVARHWASDSNYASEVVSIMNLLASRVTGNPPAPAAPPQTPVNGAVYTAVQGDNMSAIAREQGVTLGQLEQANPEAGHPAGNYGVIYVGDKFIIPGKNNPVASSAQNEGTYETVPSGHEGYLSVIAQEHGSTVADIVAWNKARYPSISPNYVQAGWYIRVK